GYGDAGGGRGGPRVESHARRRRGDGWLYSAVDVRISEPGDVRHAARVSGHGGRWVVLQGNRAHLTTIAHADGRDSASGNAVRDSCRVGKLRIDHELCNVGRLHLLRTGRARVVRLSGAGSRAYERGWIHRTGTPMDYGVLHGRELDRGGHDDLQRSQAQPHRDRRVVSGCADVLCVDAIEEGRSVDRGRGAGLDRRGNTKSGHTGLSRSNFASIGSVSLV